ncbi:hypothetical protein [Amycolatopsis anabasis]|uniref:hypothetical protein n=1 Tax=Amycolatopsis anabasis TaxID=1840409 RepID=UPI00131C9339|nr:hypothetical protein [Amycolatopsis anabasis]
MEPLDEQTLTALAGLICGDDTLYYRRAVDLVSFFRRAGWTDIADYNGDTRRSWTIEQLQRKRNDTSAIEQVLCRLVDRREYPHQPDVVTDIEVDLNRLLEAEGIHVEIDDDLRPHVRAGRAAPKPSAWEELSRSQLLYRIEDIVTDTDLVPLLNQRVREIYACRDTSCYLAAIILSGSLLEGILLDAAETRPIPDELWNDAEVKKRNIKKPRNSGDWKLYALTYVAHRLGWIDSDVHEVIDALRKFRNLVHANEQRRIIGDVPDEDTLNIYWPIVVGTINDLGRTRPSPASQPHPIARAKRMHEQGPWGVST